MASLSGRPIKAFIGIPFAEPPVGDLRFKAPQKVTPWNGTLDAQNVQSKCPQINTFVSPPGSPPDYEGDEDCLYVNVYVPKTSSTAKLDVIVWIYGGGFVQGTAGPDPYGPEYILDNDVIYVAGNYRLGALGFLSTEDSNSPGNYGLKDQSLMLQWVQDNIESFGGNKNSVTIWGESAGAYSVAYHMMSPLSQDLFHRAISESGGPVAPLQKGVALQRAKTLAQLMNCSSTDNNFDIVQCLRNASAEDMVKSGVTFDVVVEPLESDEPAFVNRRNYNNRFSNFSAIPWLVGINSEESLEDLDLDQPILENRTLLSNLLSTWDETLAAKFGFSHLNATARADITRRVNLFYFGNETTPTLDTLDIQQLLNCFTDLALVQMIQPVQARVSSNSSHSSTYLYLFSHKGTASFAGATKFLGTTHGDEMIEFFPIRNTFLFSSIPSDQDSELIYVMNRMWTNFARFGNPTPHGTALPTWPAVSSSSYASMDYMQIGNLNGLLKDKVLEVKKGYYPARAEFWKKIGEEYNLRSSWLE